MEFSQSVTPPPAAQSNEDYLLNLDREGKAPRTRVTTATALHEIYINALIADRESSRDRASVSSMIDNAPPFDQAELDALGQGQRANLNFGEGAALCEAAHTAYNDLTSSVDKIATFEIEYGDNQQRLEWEEVMAEEFDNILRGWSRFEFNVQDLARNFIDHGVGFNFWENEWDWRWKVAGLMDVFLPRHTPATTDDIDYLFVRRRYTTPQLYKYIEDRETAEKAGWNIEMTQEAIRRATTSNISSIQTMEWEQIEVEIKNNDIYFGRVRTKEIHVVHAYVVEFDGSVSHYITTENGELKDFLYKKERRFENIDQCIQLFTYGIGDGFLHSIRGLGYKVFPQVQINNMLRCGLIDSTFFAMSQIVQVDDASTMDEIAFAYFGPFSVIPTGAKIQEVTRPDLGKQGIPTIEHLEQMLHSQIGSYQPRGADLGPQGTEKTKFEVQARLQQQATISTGAMNLFYGPWEKTLNEVYRRMVQKGLQQNFPGGKEAFEFRRRCMQRHVPEEAFRKVKHVHAVRAIGFGSSSARMLALDEIAQIAPQLDEVGRRNVIRDRIAAHVGYAQADRYAPPLNQGVRPIMDQKIAELENGQMVLGQQIQVGKTEVHIVHLAVHTNEISQIINAIKAGVVPGPNGSQQLHLFLPHCAQHLQAMSVDPTRRFELRQFGKTLNLIEGFLTELDHNIAEEQQAAAKQGEQMSAMAPGEGGAPVPGGKAPVPGAQVDQSGQPPLPAGMDPKTAALLRASQVKMDIAQREAAQQMQIESAKAKQKIAWEDARFAKRAAHEGGLASQQDYQAAENEGNQQ
jgi:hypothetical protein